MLHFLLWDRTISGNGYEQTRGRAAFRGCRFIQPWTLKTEEGVEERSRLPSRSDQEDIHQKTCPKLEVWAFIPKTQQYPSRWSTSNRLGHVSNKSYCSRKCPKYPKMKTVLQARYRTNIEQITTKEWGGDMHCVVYPNHDHHAQKKKKKWRKWKRFIKNTYLSSTCNKNKRLQSGITHWKKNDRGWRRKCKNACVCACGGNCERQWAWVVKTSRV